MSDDKPIQYSYTKLFEQYEECRADNIAHFRKIMELQKENETLTAQNEVMREALNKYLDDESWIDRNRKAGWKDAHYIKSMGEMKEIARQALAKLDAIERGGG